MAAILSCIFFLLFTGFIGAITGTELVNGKHIIALGSSLSPNSISTSWPSPSGLFEFGFYKEGSGGFAVGIWLVGVKNNNTVIWTANRNDPPVASDAKLQLTRDGKLLLQTAQGQKKLVANANGTAFSASMLDSGNFVLYDKNSNVIWQSFDYPTDTILGGQVLPSGGELFSSSSETNHSNGKFRLNMQYDGNLVCYPVNTANISWDAYWATATNNIYGNLHLYLNRTGLLVIRNNTSFDTVHQVNVWSSSLTDISGETIATDGTNNNTSNNSTIYRATIDTDGILRLYAHVHVGSRELKVSKLWEALDDPCNVKGMCGFNSYCTHDDNQPYCNCLHGFELIDPNDSTCGCKRSFSEGECRDGEVEAGSYDMVSMENIVWVDLPYSELQMEMENCRLSCLEDCDCAAALYKDNLCKKQELPLRYIKRDKQESSTAFIKVGTISLKTSNHTHPILPESQPHQPPPIRSTSNKAIVQIVLVILTFAIFLCSTVLLSSHLIYKIRVLRYKRLLEIRDLGLNEEVAMRTFSYGELKRATNDFKEELGKGSFGAVYRGV